ncbi:MAG: hypothetical protein RBU21_21830, partial [FCB group bacterium]|jgi:hypothetical protein|nr:hypothetical protein [FCB group bacterium]
MPLALAIIATLLSGYLILRIQNHAVDPGTRMPSKFVLAPGVTGDIRINYEIEGAPPLPAADGYRVIRITPTRRVDTSSPMLYGKAQDLFMQELEDGSLEELDMHAVSVRKNGLTGDDNEYFHKTDELLRRNANMEALGLLGPDGKPPLSTPYELITIRENYK